MRHVLLQNIVLSINNISYNYFFKYIPRKFRKIYIAVAAERNGYRGNVQASATILAIAL